MTPATYRCAGCQASADLIDHQARKLNKLRLELLKSKDDYVALKAMYDHCAERINDFEEGFPF
jgi:hypothetical protein